MKLEHETDCSISCESQLCLIKQRQIFAVEENSSLGWSVESSDDVQKGALSRAGRSYDGYGFALLDGEINIPEDGNGVLRRLKRLGDALQLEQGEIGLVHVIFHSLESALPETG